MHSSVAFVSKAAREYLARLHPVALGHSYARHHTHVAWCELVVAAYARRGKCCTDTARYNLNRACGGESKAA